MIRRAIHPKNRTAFFIVNFITLVRLPMTIIFAHELINYLETGKQLYGLISIVISILIIFFDFIDGKLARRYDVSTRLGQLFDVYLDFIYIFVGIGILELYKRIDLGFIMVIVYKFLEFIISSKILKGNFTSKKGDDYYYDMLGTLVSAIYYIIPVMVICFIYFKIACINSIVRIILTSVTILTCIASFTKIKEIIYCIRKK